MYNSSTFFLAHGVLLKNFKLHLMLGLSIKHLIVIRLPNSSQPYCATKWFRIISNVTPCKGLFGCSTVMHYSRHVCQETSSPIRYVEMAGAGHESFIFLLFLFQFFLFLYVHFGFLFLFLVSIILFTHNCVSFLIDSWSQDIFYRKMSGLLILFPSK